MKKKKSFLDRLFAAFDVLHLIIAVVAGIAGAYLLGHVFGMGLNGYAIGFILGLAIAFGTISM